MLMASVNEFRCSCKEDLAMRGAPSFHLQYLCSIRIQVPQHWPKVKLNQRLKQFATCSSYMSLQNSHCSLQSTFYTLVCHIIQHVHWKLLDGYYDKTTLSSIPCNWGYTYVWFWTCGWQLLFITWMKVNTKYHWSFMG